MIELQLRTVLILETKQIQPLFASIELPTFVPLQISSCLTNYFRSSPSPNLLHKIGMENNCTIDSKPTLISILYVPDEPRVFLQRYRHGEDANEVFGKPVTVISEYDDSLPLADYFVSTSHNTYLVGDQLWGKSSASSYTHVINNGARCVEIDVWPSEDPSKGPIVTPGWTLTEDILFRDVCVAIRKGVEEKEDEWPIFVSLECHVGVEGQKELVRIMKDVWGKRLLDAHVEGYRKDAGQRVTPRELRGRIVMMIEYYPDEGGSKGNGDPDSSTSSSSKENKSDHSRKENGKISDELAELGIYALSVKPKKNWLEQELENLSTLINISESTLLSLLPHSLTELILHGQRHLRRVYPRGTRIMSDNLDPLVSWRAGSHFAALNWQGVDKGMQINEAMFVGSSGWVPKPVRLRADGMGMQKEEGRVGLAIDIIGLSSLPHPYGKGKFETRIHVHLYHEAGDREWKSNSVECKASAVPISASDFGADTDKGAKEHRSTRTVDAMFNETATWAFDADDLAFIRILVLDDDDSEELVVFCARLTHIQQGYRFIRLLDMEGKDSGATLLVNFTISSID